MALTYTALASVTVGSGGTTSIDFTSIPSTYTDLCLMLSGRFAFSGGGWFQYTQLRFNADSGNNYSAKWVYGFELGGGYGPVGNANYSSTKGYFCTLPTDDATASSFGNAALYIPNYAGSVTKSYSCDYVTGGNSSTQYWLGLTGGLWNNTNAINQITLYSDNTAQNFKQHTTATLYGIKNTV